MTSHFLWLLLLAVSWIFFVVFLFLLFCFALSLSWYNLPSTPDLERLYALFGVISTLKNTKRDSSMAMALFQTHKTTLHEYSHQEVRSGIDSGTLEPSEALCICFLLFFQWMCCVERIKSSLFGQILSCGSLVGHDWQTVSSAPKIPAWILGIV